MEDFDFREYADRIREALLIVDEQLLVMAEAQSLIRKPINYVIVQALPAHPMQQPSMPPQPTFY